MSAAIPSWDRRLAGRYPPGTAFDSVESETVLDCFIGRGFGRRIGVRSA
jgi:hypothetical protein